MKILTIVAVLATLLIIGAALSPMGKTNTAVAVPPAPQGAADYRNATYLIRETSVTLVDGRAEIATAPDYASKEIVAVFGEPVFKDLDGDEDDDAFLLLAQDSWGSGTFYYAAIAINNGGKYVGTNALLLGDRIAPQTLGVQDGNAVVNYAVRAEGGDFTAAPRIGKSLWINLDAQNSKISELIKNAKTSNQERRVPIVLIDASKMLKVATPVKNEKVVSPLKVTGLARGDWYFEGSFPIAIFDSSGTQLGVTSAKAKSDSDVADGAGWMTTEFISFEATLDFEKSATSTGTLLLKKDNPSGLPENDASIAIPVSF